MKPTIRERYIWIEANGEKKSEERKSIVHVIKMIKNLYSDNAPSKWKFIELLADGSNRIRWGYELTDKNLIIYYNGLHREYSNKWSDIQSIFIFCEIDWNNYFEHIKQDRIKLLTKILQESQGYHEKYNKTIIDVGELGESYIGFLFDLWISKSKITEGYDALDTNFNRVQIKTVRNNNPTLARSSQFSDYDCDYVIMVWFDEQYKLCGISLFRKSDLPSNLSPNKDYKEENQQPKKRKKQQILFSDTKKIPKVVLLNTPEDLKLNDPGSLKVKWTEFLDSFKSVEPIHDVSVTS